jgi:hypothetical protein
MSYARENHKRPLVSSYVSLKTHKGELFRLDFLPRSIIRRLGAHLLYLSLTAPRAREMQTICMLDFHVAPDPTS